MARRSNSVSSCSNRRVRKSYSPETELRKSPRLKDRRDNCETKRRGSMSSSIGSSTACVGTPTHLTATLEITMTTAAGETRYVGTWVFTLPEIPAQAHVRVATVTPVNRREEQPENPPVEAPVLPFLAPPTFDCASFLARQRKRDAMIKKRDTEIRRLEAEYANLRRQLILEEAKLTGKKKICKTPWIAGEMERAALKKVKIEEEEHPLEQDFGPSTQVRDDEVLGSINQ